MVLLNYIVQTLYIAKVQIAQATNKSESLNICSNFIFCLWLCHIVRIGVIFLLVCAENIKFVIIYSYLLCYSLKNKKYLKFNNFKKI